MLPEVAATNAGPRLTSREISVRVFVIALGLVPLLMGIPRTNLQDVGHYVDLAFLFRDGQIPNIDFAFEYPPIAGMLFLPGLLSRDPRVAGFIISSFFALFDLALRILLVREGRRRFPEAWSRALLPIGLFTVLTWTWGYWYLRRFDMVPAVMVAGAVIVFSQRRHALAGVLLTLSIFTKLYPVLLVPIFLLTGNRESRTRFTIASALTALPIFALGLVWPWWKFALFHANRGLQVESFAASVLWALKTPLNLAIEWVEAPAAWELHGALPDAARSITSVVWLIATALSVAVTSWNAFRNRPTTLSDLARMSLLPLLAFVAFNAVLSPQYMVWLMTLACLAVIDQPFKTMWPLFLAFGLTALFYPTRSYGSGLDAIHTVPLVLRNVLLIGFWVRELVMQLRSPPRGITLTT